MVEAGKNLWRQMKSEEMFDYQIDIAQKPGKAFQTELTNQTAQ